MHAPNLDSLLARRMRRVAPSPIMELIKAGTQGDYISFASGLPDPRLYPADLIRSLADDILIRDGRTALQYGAAEGYLPLRETVAGILRGRGLDVGPEHVLITSGSQQSIDLVARMLLNPGDRVILEDPTYLAALQVFDSNEAEYLPVPQDGQGMVTDALPATLAAGPKLLYALPNFQNPTGVSMSTERRAAAARFAAENGIALLEDDAYSDLRYHGEPLPPVVTYAVNRWAFYTGTFSKNIAPGLRVGYLVGDPDLIARATQLKQVTDLHAGSLSQRVVHRFCAEGHLEPNIRKLRAAYSSRLAVLEECLREHLGGLVEWTCVEGGMFLWVRLPEACDTAPILTRAMSRGVMFVPGTGFHVPDHAGTRRGRNTMRLNFASEDEDRIREGMAILGSVIRESLA